MFSTTYGIGDVFNLGTMDHCRELRRADVHQQRQTDLHGCFLNLSINFVSSNP